VEIRNCAWTGGEKSAKPNPVWARRGVFSLQCPKSVITAYSMYLLDVFQWWKQLGGGDIWSFDAKVADAMILLESAWREEKKNGEEQQ